MAKAKKTKVKKEKKVEELDLTTINELLDQLSEGGPEEGCCGYECGSSATEAWPVVVFDRSNSNLYGPFKTQEVLEEWLENASEDDDFCLDDLVVFTISNPAKVKREWLLDDIPMDDVL